MVESTAGQAQLNLKNSADEWAMYMAASGTDLRFWNGSDLVTFQASGNVGIGTTTPAQALEVKGSIRQSGCITAGTLSANVTGDIICTSDENLKDIFGFYQGSLDVLSSINPIRFSYKGESFIHVGFSAQNVKAVLPEASALQNNGYWSLDNTSVIALTVNAIKELASTTLALQNQINALIATSTLTAANGSFTLSTMNSDLNLNGFSLLNVKSITGINGLWRIDEGGNITAQSVETQALTVGGGAASGVTIYDRTTTAPKCIYIEGGVIKTSDGACGTTQNAGVPASIFNDQNATTTTPIVETPVVATSTLDIIPTATTTPIIAPASEPVIVSTTTPETATTTP
ncbi:MAG: tail fiber domain-containing protein, partial [Candidatus Azambacteria bacterium]|nr:tail fiber domain-containing protein [Candidatus Azambacteria bacterium]